MEVKQTIYYDIDKSSERIDEILNSSNTNYSDSDKVPKCDDLTYTNSMYLELLCQKKSGMKQTFRQLEKCMIVCHLIIRNKEHPENRP